MTQSNVKFAPPSLDPALASLIDELTAKQQGGEKIDLAAVMREHPQFADDLRELLPALAALCDLSKSPTGSFPLSDADGNPLDGTLGDFRLIRELGRGGMGIVYETEQISLNRKVALKVLPFAATMDPRHLQRFRNEAQAAACLHHPNIVPVHGVGCDRGVHYYAMQLIEGQTLAEVIADRRGNTSCHSERPPCHSERSEESTGPREGASRSLASLGMTNRETVPNALLSTKRDRAHFRHIATLIASAADALEYAHLMGVVHRDIKPGNLMLDFNSPLPASGRGAGGEGCHLWITDFGLAKLASPDRKVGDNLTLTGDLIGTLRYMSPEQALAKHGLVDHRTDIYSLGATLYELLTLKPAVAGNDKAEILKSIAWDEPIPLRKHDKSIPAELETITLKCLAKEPGERYLTAGELAEDLRRWLANKPIQARPPTLWDRAGRWISRHRAIVATTISLLVLITVGLSTGLTLLNHARKQEVAQRERAQYNLRLALSALGESSQRLINSMVTRPMGRAPEEVAAARKLVAYFEDFVRTNEGDPALRKELSEAYLSIGSIASTLEGGALPRPWMTNDPRPFSSITSAVVSNRGVEETRKALALVDALLIERPDDPNLIGHRAHGTAQLARLLANSPEAEPLFGEALRLFEIVRQAGNSEGDKFIAIVRNQFGMMLLDAGRPAEAETQFRQAAMVYEALAAASPNDPLVPGFQGGILNVLAVTLHRTDRLVEAHEVIQRAIAHQRESIRLDPRDPTWRLALRNELGLLCELTIGRGGTPRDVIPLRAECVAISERLHEEYRDFLDYRFQLANDLGSLSNAFADARQFEQALPPCERSVALLESLVAEAPANSAYRNARDEGLRCLLVLRQNSMSLNSEKRPSPSERKP